MALEHLDTESLDMLREVMGNEFSQLIETFVNDSDLRVESIKAAVDAADPDATRRSAHGLKGSASNMGALLLADMCRRLEEMGLQGGMEGAADLFKEVSSEYAAVRDALLNL